MLGTDGASTVDETLILGSASKAAAVDLADAFGAPRNAAPPQALLAELLNND
jgi:hypothetical protein